MNEKTCRASRGDWAGRNKLWKKFSAEFRRRNNASDVPSPCWMCLLLSLPCRLSLATLADQPRESCRWYPLRHLYSSSIASCRVAYPARCRLPPTISHPIFVHKVGLEGSVRLQNHRSLNRWRIKYFTRLQQEGPNSEFKTPSNSIYNNNNNNNNNI